MKEIRGDAKNIRQLLSGTKYAIDYYQREYKWQTKQVAELIDDLTIKFFESYEEGHDRSEVAEYGHYYLGSIIISDKDGQKFLIDGQQRLTSLTLMLIYVHQLLENSEQRGQVAELIFSQRYGTKSFNLDVPERKACMEALYAGESFDENGEPESVRNILGRYQDIHERLPDGVAGKALPYFVDWLIENVHLVEITAYSDEDAYTIFETMNDRGLSLTPTDMLKGYLLANIKESQERTTTSKAWRKQVVALQALGNDDEAKGKEVGDGIKSRLRSQHAQSIRERKRGAEPRDFDLIGTEFHRWVRNHGEDLGLSAGDDFARFIERDFAFYGSWYKRLRMAAEELEDGLKCVHYNAQHNFTLQYPVLLAPLQIGDSEESIYRKLRVVAAYLDILIHRRIWNWRAIDYSTMQYAMFVVMREIRGKSAEAVSVLLRKRLDAEEEVFATNDRFNLHGTNGRQIHRMLVRMTAFIEVASGQADRYSEYVHRAGKKGYEVEHIWADHPERHKDEFSHPHDFAEYRNRVGGLLILPKSFNASYGDMTFKRKRKHYLKQNLLAQSLHEDAYERNPGFRRFLKESGLPFKPHADFDKRDLDARQELYSRLAELIWNPDRLSEEAVS